MSNDVHTGGQSTQPSPANNPKKGEWMCAVRCHGTSGPAGLRLGKVPAPECPPGQLRIRVTAAGVNFADTPSTRNNTGEPARPF